MIHFNKPCFNRFPDQQNQIGQRLASPSDNAGRPRGPSVGHRLMAAR
jgi:hypothetical protein